MVKRTDWEDGWLKDMPNNAGHFTLKMSLSDSDIAKIKRGYAPQEMDIKWLMYYENGKLFIHRSWTGLCVYMVNISKSGTLDAYMNSDVWQEWVEPSVKINDCRGLIEFLIAQESEEETVSQELVEITAAGEVFPAKGMPERPPFDHQQEAMKALDKMDNAYKAYSTMVVLPTGAGKTYTASKWLLRRALDKEIKILWLAHRQTLLDQAAKSFIKFATAAELPHITSFRYRIVSGATKHDRAVHIEPTDNLLIISKDSIGKNMERLDPWIKDEKEIYMVVDEAHHSTAKTYQKVIKYVAERVPNVKLIGLTATPFRTSESEQMLLADIYHDGIENGNVVHNKIGMVYKTDLKTLINRHILSKPRFETYYTDENYGEGLGSKALETIQNLDALPPDIAKKIAESGPRNRLILDTYKAKAKEYGQTIIFTVSIDHAIALTKLFNDAKIPARYIVSTIKDGWTGVTISSKNNEEYLEEYRRGDVQVLINVNILTEGVDLPMTKTVFLARPTVSTILMTQMVGRALRGEAAGGTPYSYIVAFMDDWNEHISWVSPETIFFGGREDPGEVDYKKRELRWIAISKIEEFAAIINDSIDTTELEAVPFFERIPIGMYAFQYINEDGVDFSYQVMVYNSTKDAYEKFMEELPNLFDWASLEGEYLSAEQLEELEQKSRDKFFCEEMIPTYDPKDVQHILKYYAQKDFAPRFYTFDQVDRDKLDVHLIARKIWDERMDRQTEQEYVDELWENSDDNILRLFFGKKTYLRKLINIEILKISDPPEYPSIPQVKYDKRPIETLTLYEISQINPAMGKKLYDDAYANAKVEGGYQCAKCGKVFPDRHGLEVDHIKPMNAGGLSVSDNLQVLCKTCNASKGYKAEE